MATCLPHSTSWFSWHGNRCWSTYGYLDMELVSAIGSENGDVYGKLLGWAKRDPMNEGDVIDQWDEHYGKLLAQGRIDLLNFTGQTLESIPAIDQTSSHTFGVAKL
eukprot:m.96182 g.96182  ORF g.96182 m.96182 type:complete len:106 (+) comp26873_c1_seq2:1934-2251(+)